MPIGYLVTTGGVAAVAVSAARRHGPRRPSPFRPSYVFGLWLDWPLFTFLLLVASTALAIEQSGAGSPWVWTGLGLTVVASAALAVLRRQSRSTGPVLERALDEGLGADWRKKVIAWAREHGREYGADPTAVFLAGSSLGGHFASLAADTSIAGVVSLYGYYGHVAPDEPPSSRFSYPTADAPPCFVAHGDRDTLVPVEDARAFAGQLRATSSNPVVYAELPGAQHGFDLFRSRRFDSVVDAIDAFTCHIRLRR